MLAPPTLGLAPPSTGKSWIRNWTQPACVFLTLLNFLYSCTGEGYKNISEQWRIQDFPEEGALTLKGENEIQKYTPRKDTNFRLRRIVYYQFKVI